MLSLNQNEIEAKIDTFNWNFKVGDNINHNLEEVFYLCRVKIEHCSNINESRFLNKHISMTLISIIEAILYDFVVRLNDATNQFPIIINITKREAIKKYILEQRVPYELKKSKIKILKVKNYSLLQILKLLQKFELLEKEDSLIYKQLEGAIHFRNRVHIYNWFDNFEIDERYVFTDKRLEILERLFIYIIVTMESKYSRTLNE